MRKAEKIKTYPFDAAEHLNTVKDIAYFIEAALDEGDEAGLIHALNAVGRSKGMATLAKKTGISRESLYKSLRGKSKPQFSTIHKIIKALGLRLEVHPANSNEATPVKRAKGR